MKFSIKDFFSKYLQIRRKLRIWSHLLKKSLIENFIFFFCSKISIYSSAIRFRLLIKLVTILCQRGIFSLTSKKPFRNHLFSMYANFPEKNNVYLSLIRTRTYVCVSGSQKSYFWKDYFFVVKISLQTQCKIHIKFWNFVEF